MDRTIERKIKEMKWSNPRKKRGGSAKGTTRKLPSRSVIEKAVKNMQLYLGLLADVRARVSDLNKLKARVDKSVLLCVKATGNTEDNVWMQLEAEARRRGIMMPLPGRDI